MATFGGTSPDLAANYFTYGVTGGKNENVLDVVNTLTVPAGGITISALERGMDSATGQAGATVSIGIYDITSGITNAPLLASATINSRSDNAGYVWHSVSTSINVTAGKIIAIGSGRPTSDIWHTCGASTASVMSPATATLAANWNETSAFGRLVPLRATYTVNSAFSVDTITSSITHGGSGTFTYTGLGTITAMTVDGIAVASVSGTGGSGTFTMPARTNGAILAGYGTGKVVVITGSLGSANTVITVNPPATQAYVTETTVDSSSDAYIAHSSYGLTVVTDDTFAYDTAATLGVATNYIGNDSSINTSYAGTQIAWHWNHFTKVTTQITIINGVVVPSSTINFVGKLLPNIGSPIFQSSYRNGDRSNTTPNAFVFTDVTGATINSVNDSNTITVSGINTATAISITGGTYKIGSGSYTASAGTVTNGQTVVVRVTASGSNSTAVNAVLTIGGVSDTFTVTTLASGVVTRYSEEFESGSVPPNWIAYGGGTTVQVITDTAQTYNGSAGSLKATYPLTDANGNIGVIGAYDLSAFCSQGASNHIYIDFYAKMPNSKQGLKFCKIFGGNGGGNITANTTFGLDYTGDERGGMVYVAFGDGTTNSNDTAQGVWLDGTHPTWVGRSYGLAGHSSLTPQNSKWLASNWTTGWHRFQFYVKFNSGTTALNEVNDGAVKVIIDGVTYVDAVGLYNRHYSNLPIDHLHFFEWAQTGTEVFDIWADSIRISQNGWTR